MAHEGTLFLDEIGDMPVTLQAKLLRVLEDNIIQPLGSVKEKQVDFRLLTATHQNLGKLIAAKQFREDLHYRLNVISLQLPRLAEREQDIILLAMFFLGKLIRVGDSSVAGIEWTLFQQLSSQYIGGNVRELENLLTRLIFQSDGDVLRADTLNQILDQRQAVTPPTEQDDPDDTPPGIQPLKDVEKDAIIRALLALKGNISQTASQLGISRTALYRKINNYDLGEYLVDSVQSSGSRNA